MNEDASILPVSCSLSLRHLFPPPLCLVLSLPPPAPTPPPLSRFSYTLCHFQFHSLALSGSFAPLLTFLFSPTLSLSIAGAFFHYVSFSRVPSLTLSLSLLSHTSTQTLPPLSPYSLYLRGFLLQSIACLCKVTHCAQPSGPKPTAQDLTLPQTTEL